eukprot:TRINITY_DN18431_c0_g1_i1.p2 TRINITY_DN18431_c0_g1~~TRINITY_DN18431_c0_g1_i1.p2  ORF type:complete len:109 (-),score=33.93 TRINITY_DN18431_c0_g1_i1:190-516(-)
MTQAGRAVAVLNELISQQEHQVRLLETINQKKGDQLMSLQRRFEQALEALHVSQLTYDEQRQVVDAQQDMIHKLACNLRVAAMAESACNEAAAEAAAGFAAAAAARGA